MALAPCRSAACFSNFPILTKLGIRRSNDVPSELVPMKFTNALFARP